MGAHSCTRASGCADASGVARAVHSPRLTRGHPQSIMPTKIATEWPTGVESRTGTCTRAHRGEYHRAAQMHPGVQVRGGRALSHTHTHTHLPLTFAFPLQSASLARGHPAAVPNPAGCSGAQQLGWHPAVDVRTCRLLLSPWAAESSPGPQSPGAEPQMEAVGACGCAAWTGPVEPGPLGTSPPSPLGYVTAASPRPPGLAGGRRRAGGGSCRPLWAQLTGMGGARVRGREGSSGFGRLPQGWWQRHVLLVFRSDRIAPPPSVFQAAGVAAGVTQSGFGTSGISGRHICRAVSPVGAEPGGGQGEDGDPRVSPSPCSDQRPWAQRVSPHLGPKIQLKAQARLSRGRLTPTVPAFHSLQARWQQHSQANLSLVTAGWSPVLSPSSFPL